MGITFSLNSLGVNNINLVGAQKLGDEHVQALVGLFANVNLDGGPLVKGFFGETSVNGNAINIAYAAISTHSVNFQGGLRLRLFKDDLSAADLNVYLNSTNMFNTVKFSRFGGNICWNFPEGHMLAVGASHTPFFNSTTVDWICKINLWRSDNQAFNIALTTNVTFHVRGPFAGYQNIVASLAVSYDMLHSLRKEKVLIN